MNDQDPTVPYGYCHCGCGRKAQIAKYSSKSHGYVAGEPRQYVKGHGSRKRENTRYRVEDCGHETPCWIWQLSLDKDGYGYEWAEVGNTRRAHRRMYERTNGPIPQGLQLDHLCRNRACVNPDHLEPVTNRENHRRAPKTKLTVGKVRDIRRRLEKDESRRELAARFGVSYSTIRAIAEGRNWRGV